MKIYHFSKTLLVLMLLAIASPSSLASNTLPSIENREEHAARLKNRLEEIKAMDTKKLSRTEKKELRGEVRAIKKELAAIGGGIYLSVGAVLLILLLILLLA